MRQLLTAPIAFYKACILIVVIATVVAGLVYYKIDRVYDYKLALPSQTATQEILEYGPWNLAAHPEFFESVKKELREQKANFIEANLSMMQVTVYRNGEPTKTVPIISKGKPGSWWETPAGIYKIETKEKNHFSTFGHVYQPWSMLFQGNFFIHGWPTYEDGSEVPAGYSGGCIRLSTPDAKDIYDQASVGMPIIVLVDDFQKDSFVYKQKEPQVTASAYLVADIKNNAIIAQKNSDEVRSIASITKLMTALVAAESINMDKQITITPDMQISTSKPRLQVGSRIQAFQLLYPLLQESSNEAAVALATQLPGNMFVREMNKKAMSIGLQNTKFEDSTGSGSGNRASSKDLFGLLKYLYINRSFILSMSAGRITKSIYGQPAFQDIQNFNWTTDDSEFIGGKVGETQASGQTMASVFEIPINGSIRPIAIIVLGSLNNHADTAVLLNHIRSLYQ